MSAGTPPTARTLVGLLQHQADRYGDKVAFRFCPDGGDEQDRLTYRELDIRARAVAAALQRQGAAGHRVLHIMEPGLDNVVGFFGCVYAGAVAVPVNEDQTTVKAVLPDAQAGFLLATTRTQASLRPTLTGLIGGRSVRWCTLDEIAGDAERWAPDWSPPDVDEPDAVAVIQYLSDAAHPPKAVLSTHRNILCNVASIQQRWRTDEQAIGVSWLPQYHNAGLIAAVIHQLYVGCTTILMSPAAFLRRPMCWLEAISRHRATLTAAPYFGYRLCVERSTPSERAALDLSSLSLAIGSTGPISGADVRAFTEAFAPAGFRPDAFFTAYGLAEATMAVSCRSISEPLTIHRLDGPALDGGRVADAAPDDPQAVEVVSSGPALSGQRVVVVDPESRRTRGPDEVGEIWVAGPHVGRGYWRRPEETERTFAAFLSDTGEGPFLRTGTLGFVRAGELFIVGQWSDLITVNHTNYYPDDLEATVPGCHPALRSGRVAAFAVRPRPRVDNRLVIVHELDGRSQPTEAELADMVRAIRAGIVEQHGLEPHDVVLVGPKQLPAAADGRVERGLCRNRFLQGELAVLAEWHAPAARLDHRDGAVRFATKLLTAELARRRRQRTRRG